MSRAAAVSERLAAAAILGQVESGRRLDVAWQASGARKSPRRGWVRRLAYGVVRLRGRIDHILSRCCRRPLDELDPEVLAALRMGVYQILEMDAVPAYAAVSEAVDQAKRGSGAGAARLVNAVLRNVTRSAPDRSWFPDPAEDLAGHLSTWGSHPEWLVRRWIAAFGPDGAAALAAANNREPELYFRPVGVDAAEARGALAEAGLLAGPDELADIPSIRLARGADPGAALAVAPGVIQDPAASLVADYAAVRPGALVADLCAAPGGKALVMSAAAGGVVAADLSPLRLARVADGAARLGARVWPVAADARHPPVRSADVVLVDAPCTGTGTLRRHPDGRWRLREPHVAAMAAVQRSLLDGAAGAVPRGGLLVYATCALEREENSDQVDAFLARHPDFRIEAGPAPRRFLDADGCLGAYPHDSGFDGAFAARMRRASE